MAHQIEQLSDGSAAFVSARVPVRAKNVSADVVRATRIVTSTDLAAEKSAVFDLLKVG